MEEGRGFEPLRDLTPLSVFKTDPFSQTWVSLRKINDSSDRLELVTRRIMNPYALTSTPVKKIIGGA
jgi:hypothetical protein